MTDKEILLTEGTPPPAIARVLRGKYGTDWLTWEPITLWAEIKEDYGIDLEQEQKDAIMALRTCMKTESPWKEWYPFTRVANALNGNPTNRDYVSPPSISSIAYAVDMMKRMKPDVTFSDEVRRMMALVLWDKGICWAPVSGLGMLVNDILIEYQESPEQRIFLSFLAKDYLSYDGLDAMDEYDAVRMHTIKLKSLDLYVSMKRKAEEA